jgi:hypothetical protein
VGVGLWASNLRVEVSWVWVLCFGLRFGSGGLSFDLWGLGLGLEVWGLVLGWTCKALGFWGGPARLLRGGEGTYVPPL